MKPAVVLAALVALTACQPDPFGRSNAELREEEGAVVVALGDRFRGQQIAFRGVVGVREQPTKVHEDVRRQNILEQLLAVLGLLADRGEQPVVPLAQQVRLEEVDVAQPVVQEAHEVREQPPHREARQLDGAPAGGNVAR